MNILKYTGFDKNESTVKREIVAGLTTFITMSYILAVNPNILGESGMDKGAVFTATALTSAIATIMMAFMGKLPFAQAPGMALNAFFTFTIVKQLGYSWQTGLTIMFIVSVLYSLIILFNIQNYILKAIPQNIRKSITVGVGLFIAFIGLQNAGIVVKNPDTIVEMGSLNRVSGLAFLGIILSAVLYSKRVKGGLFISIIICTLIGIPLGVTNLSEFKVVSMPSSLKPVFGLFDFSNIFDSDLIIVMFTLLFLCIFDTMGTLLGLADKTGKLDSNGNLPHMKGALLSNSLSSAFGAILGTSAVSNFAESASGIAEGGKSGLTSLTVGVLFLFSLLFSGIFLIIPMAATTGSLVMVGVLMIGEIKSIDFSDVTEALPAFLTITMIPLTYSIGGGIMIGILSYVLVKLIAGRFKETNFAMYLLAILIILKFIFGN